MPKRHCPFDENLMPQVKVHVTEKEYNENTGKGMNNVFNKTTSLLFNGVKKLYNTKIKSDSKNNDSITEIDTLEEIICISCKQHNFNVSKCWYCDKQLCTSCLGPCVRCKESHCRNCSIESYDDTFNGLVCLSCYNN